MSRFALVYRIIARTLASLRVGRAALEARVESVDAVATRARRRAGIRRDCSSRFAESRRYPVVSEDARAMTRSVAQWPPAPLAASSGAEKRARHSDGEFQNDASPTRIAIEFFLVTSVRFLSRMRSIRVHAAS